MLMGFGKGGNYIGKGMWIWADALMAVKYEIVIATVRLKVYTEIVLLFSGTNSLFLGGLIWGNGVH